MNKISFLLVVVSALVSLLTYSQLPEIVPTHWNYLGQVDGYAPKMWASLMFPAFSVALYLLFLVVPKIDVKNSKYELFKPEWNIIQTAIIAFFVYIQSITIYIAINPSVQMVPLMFLGLGSLFVLLGNYLSKIRQNYFLGIRLPWTLASEENWNKTHRFASWCFVLVGLVFLIEAVIQVWVPVVTIVSILFAVILPGIYSYRLYRRQTKSR